MRRLGCILTVFAAIVSAGCGAQAAHGRNFVVRGDAIIAPNGNRLVVRGVTAVYGAFAGGDSETAGLDNLEHARDDFARLKRDGVNLIRILASTSVLGSDQQKELVQVVREARSQGLIVEIAADEQVPELVLPVLRFLARTFKRRPYVWIGTSNEPLCPGADCGNWPEWQLLEHRYIALVRDEGVESPIVVDGPDYSWNLSEIQAYPVGGQNIVYGAHIYANNVTSFGAAQAAEVDGEWADLASRYAVIVEEVGTYNGPTFPNRLSWAQGFIRFLAHWVNTGSGSGAIGFTWHWVDPNSMTRANYSLDRWGKLFMTHYVRAVISRSGG